MDDDGGRPILALAFLSLGTAEGKSKLFQLQNNGIEIKMELRAASSKSEIGRDCNLLSDCDLVPAAWTRQPRSIGRSKRKWKQRWRRAE